jgi:hypothetical protein
MRMGIYFLEPDQLYYLINAIKNMQMVIGLIPNMYNYDYPGIIKLN